MAIISQRCCYIVTKNHSYSSKPSCELTAHWIKPLTLQPSKYDCSSIGHNWCLAMINQPNLIKSVTPRFVLLKWWGQLTAQCINEKVVHNKFVSDKILKWLARTGLAARSASIGWTSIEAEVEWNVNKNGKDKKILFLGQKYSRELLPTFFSPGNVLCIHKNGLKEA